MQRAGKGKLWVKPNNTYSRYIQDFCWDILCSILNTAKPKHHLKSMFGALEPPMLHAWFQFAVISQILPVKLKDHTFRSNSLLCSNYLTCKQSLNTPARKDNILETDLRQNVSARGNSTCYSIQHKEGQRGILTLRNFFGFLLRDAKKKGNLERKRTRK